MLIEECVELLEQDRGSFIPLDCLDIKDDIYLINEYGDIYSIASHRLLTQGEDKDGYKDIMLQTNNKRRKSYRIATLVAYTFIGLPSNEIKDPTIDHIDSNKLNNHYSNLRWMERYENSSIRKTKPKGELNGQHILNEEDVIKICELLQEGKLSLTEIGDMFNVKKSTISKIKRGKNWKYISEKYNFTIKETKNKDQVEKQKEEIIKLFQEGLKPKEIIKMGYPNTTVRRYYKTFCIK